MNSYQDRLLMQTTFDRLTYNLIYLHLKIIKHYQDSFKRFVRTSGSSQSRRGLRGPAAGVDTRGAAALRTPRQRQAQGGRGAACGGRGRRPPGCRAVRRLLQPHAVRLGARARALEVTYTH